MLYCGYFYVNGTWYGASVSVSFSFTRALSSDDCLSMFPGLDFPKNWVALCTDRISIYDNEYDVEPKINIGVNAILSIDVHRDER